jgi:hypothetical protein
MSQNLRVVAFTYDLTSEVNLNAEFKEVLEGLNWKFQISTNKLPQSTCLKVYSESVKVDEALKLATLEIKEVVKKIRENGFKNFNVEKYFFLSHETKSSNAHFGQDLF